MRRRRSLARRRAFTLVEVMIASSLGSLILAAVLTTFLFLGRTGMATQNYTDLEAQARTAMDTFALDVRRASGSTWNSSTSLTLTLKENGSTVGYTYSYSSSAGTFSRQKTSPSTGTADVLITGVTAFTFTAYKINTDTINLSSISSTTNSMTKQVQIALTAARSQSALVTATNSVVSARFILRNKRVTS